jgi:hypothetical protein
MTCPAQASFFWCCAHSPSPTYLRTPAHTLLLLSKSPIQVTPSGWPSTHSFRTKLCFSFPSVATSLEADLVYDTRKAKDGSMGSTPAIQSVVLRTLQASLHPESFTLPPQTHVRACAGARAVLPFTMPVLAWVCAACRPYALWAPAMVPRLLGLTSLDSCRHRTTVLALRASHRRRSYSPLGCCHTTMTYP